MRTTQQKRGWKQPLFCWWGIIKREPEGPDYPDFPESPDYPEGRISRKGRKSRRARNIRISRIIRISGRAGGPGYSIDTGLPLSVALELLSIFTVTSSPMWWRPLLNTTTLFCSVLPKSCSRERLL